MKKVTIVLFALLMIGGCAAFEETYYVDREFGLTSQAAFENQIAYSQDEIADDTPKGLEGIDAERMMTAHNEGFGKPPQETNVFNISLTK